ncbi:hypothetical protein QOZ80_1BG0092490 [Eleusine coracana subsp. coracana]|nr:hypothetical protein QOZ80_1BG0092490 [Eleusine coracana subsp. coracana]
MSTFMPPAAYGAGADHETAAARGSYGPVIGMLALVLVLAAAAVAVGRLCFGRRPGALGHDLEAWVERTCGPCVGVTRAQAKEEEGGGTATATVTSVQAATEQPPGGTTTVERGEASSSGGGS